MHQHPRKNRPDRTPNQTIDSLRVPEAHLKIQVVTAVTGRSESTIRRLVAAGEFPSPIKDGTRCTRWVAGQVSAWLSAKGGAA